MFTWMMSVIGVMAGISALCLCVYVVVPPFITWATCIWHRKKDEEKGERKALQTEMPLYAV